MRHVTGKPIVFMGVGEKTDALEPFHPERVASRILGMGDVLGLVEQVDQQVDREKAEKLARKLTRGHGVRPGRTCADQLHQLQEMGGLGALVDKLPAELCQRRPHAAGQLDEGQLRRQIAIIILDDAPRSAAGQNLIDGSRKRRIAGGAGVQVQDVNRLLKQFLQMQKTMKRLSKGGLQKLLRGMGAVCHPFGRGDPAPVAPLTRAQSI